MPSFQLSITPKGRARARFLSGVRRALQKALAEEHAARGLTQAAVAREIGVHRSVISRQFAGFENMTLGRVAEIAHALGREPELVLHLLDAPAGTNSHVPSDVSTAVVTDSAASHVDLPLAAIAVKGNAIA